MPVLVAAVGQLLDAPHANGGAAAFARVLVPATVAEAGPVAEHRLAAVQVKLRSTRALRIADRKSVV